MARSVSVFLLSGNGHLVGLAVALRGGSSPITIDENGGVQRGAPSRRSVSNLTESYPREVTDRQEKTYFQVEVFVSKCSM